MADIKNMNINGMEAKNRKGRCFFEKVDKINQLMFKLIIVKKQLTIRTLV
jgi:hypothetical protein